MLVRMRHLEMHLVEDEADAAKLEHIGLIRFETDEFCEHCDEPIAYVYKYFEPCVLILDEESGFLLCTYCAAPVLSPASE